MKEVLFYVLLSTALLLGYGCSPSEDSNKQAEEQNDQRIDDLPDNAANLPADSKSNTKDVAEFLIALNNTGLTELKLSQLALQRAQNAELKAYARQTVDQHTQAQNKLREQAQKFQITLPTTLSTDSQTMLTKLSEEQNGPDFDKRYAKYMVEVNDMALGKIKNLVKNTNSPELKTLVQQINLEDEKHMNDAERLEGNL